MSWLLCLLLFPQNYTMSLEAGMTGFFLSLFSLLAVPGYRPPRAPSPDQGFSESRFFSRIWDMSRDIRIYPLECFRHLM